MFQILAVIFFFVCYSFLVLFKAYSFLVLFKAIVNLISWLFHFHWLVEEGNADRLHYLVSIDSSFWACHLYLVYAYSYGVFGWNRLGMVRSFTPFPGFRITAGCMTGKKWRSLWDELVSRVNNSIFSRFVFSKLALAKQLAFVRTMVSFWAHAYQINDDGTSVAPRSNQISIRSGPFVFGQILVLFPAISPEVSPQIIVLLLSFYHTEIHRPPGYFRRQLRLLVD